MITFLEKLSQVGITLHAESEGEKKKKHNKSITTTTKKQQINKHFRISSCQHSSRFHHFLAMLDMQERIIELLSTWTASVCAECTRHLQSPTLGIIMLSS